MLKKVLSLVILIYSIGYSQKNNYLITLDSLIEHENLPFHSGKFHLDILKKSPTSKTDIYYLPDIKTGSFVFNNQHYLNVNLKYDVLSDQLIYYHSKTATNGGIIIEKTKIKEFFIDSFHFIKDDSLGYLEIKSNFKDNNKLLIKHVKLKSEKINSNAVYWNFSNKFQFYFEKNKEIFYLKNRKSVVKLFPKKKEEILQFYEMKKKLLKDNKINFYEKLFQLIYEN